MVVPPAAVTVRLTVVVCVMEPPVPVTVMEYVPVTVDEPTVKVNVEGPDPGAAIEVGLNAAVMPVGRPDAESATAELNPPETLVLMVDVPVPPCAMETLVGEAEMVKSGTGAAVTVKLMVEVCVVEPPVPVTVIEYVPGVVEPPTVNVSVEEPEPGAVMEAGLNPAVTPAGRPDAESETAELNPPETLVLMVDVPELPCITETLAGEAEMAKSGVLVVVAFNAVSSTTKEVCRLLFSTPRKFTWMVWPI